MSSPYDKAIEDLNWADDYIRGSDGRRTATDHYGELMKALLGQLNHHRMMKTLLYVETIGGDVTVDWRITAMEDKDDE